MISNRRSRKGRVPRRILIASALIAGTFGSVWIAAELDMARERGGVQTIERAIKGIAVVQ